MTGRVALVTGAARGIGAATVAALAADGWRVIAVDRCADDPALPYPLGSRAELDQVVAAAPDPAAVAAVEADVRDPDALAAAVRLAGERWGGLDAAIAAAGVIAGGVPAWQVPPGQERAVLDVDLGGVLNLARAAVPALLRRPDARRVLRGQGRGDRVRPRAGRRTRRHRHHGERGQPGLDADPDAGRERPALRPARGRGLRGPAAAGPAGVPGRGGRGHRVPGRGRRQRHDRGGRPGRRRPGLVTYSSRAASRVMSTLASALLTGQPSFAV